MTAPAMTALRKLWRLPAEDRALLCEAAAWVVAIRVGLWALPFGAVRRIVCRAGHRRVEAASAPEASVERVVWAVRAASARVPRASCLTQALAARALLARRGLPSDLRIGVARSSENGIEGHAWLERNGRIVIGESEPERYKPLGAP